MLIDSITSASNGADSLVALQGDIGALDTDLTTAQGDITTAQGDITALEGNMTTAQGDITALEGNMTTAQADIIDIQSDVSTAQTDITNLQGSSYNVKDYGATGDGTTNDTTAINLALAAANATTNGAINTLFFPAGTYMITPGSMTAITCHIEAPGSVFKARTSTNAALITIGWNYYDYGTYIINIGVLRGYNFSFGNNTNYGTGITFADAANHFNDRCEFNIGMIEGFINGVYLNGYTTNLHIGEVKLRVNTIWCCNYGIFLYSGNLQIENNDFHILYMTYCRTAIRMVSAGTANMCQNTIRVNCLELHAFSGSIGINLGGTKTNQNKIIIDDIYYTANTSYIVVTDALPAGNVYELPGADYSKISGGNDIYNIGPNSVGLINSTVLGRSVFYGSAATFAAGGMPLQIGARFIINNPSAGGVSSYCYTSGGWKAETTLAA